MATGQSTVDVGATPQAAQAPEAPQANDQKQHGKRPFQGHQGHQRKPTKHRRKQQKAAQEGSIEEVLRADVQALLAAQKKADEAEDGAAKAEAAPLPEQGSEIEVEVVELSSTGDGLAKQKGSDNIYVVPFSIPGDTVKVKVYRHNPDEGYTAADFISVVKPSPLRDDSRIQCGYFSKCSGCQFQMLDYDEQLRVKKNIVVKAYRNFSQLTPELVPEILDTIGSPLQYGYRTKLTPHFDGPPGNPRRGPKKGHSSVPTFGFTPKGTRKVLDIEDCPIATDAVRKGLGEERARLAVEYGNYTKGATILLRESTKRVPKASPTDTLPVPEGTPETALRVEADTHTDFKTCITDQNATSTEYIDDFTFQNPAGSFFQNNNSILPPFTAYIREHILPPLAARHRQAHQVPHRRVLGLGPLHHHAVVALPRRQRRHRHRREVDRLCAAQRRAQRAAGGAVPLHRRRRARAVPQRQQVRPRRDGGGAGPAAQGVRRELPEAAAAVCAAEGGVCEL
jgi:tRNA (uracil-5-)-methyltransferase